MLKLTYIKVCALVAMAFIFPTKILAANPLNLEIYPSSNATTVNNKITVQLRAKTSSDLEVNSMLSGLKIPKPLTISNLNYNLGTSFVFNHLTTSDKGTYTQIEILFTKQKGDFFILKNNDPIISFDITSNSAGTFNIEPANVVHSVYDKNEAELFNIFAPSNVGVTFNSLIPTPTPTPTPVEPTPSPTPEIPTPTPTPVVPTPTPEPTVVPSPTIEPSVEPTIVPTVLPTPTPIPSPITFTLPTKIEAEDYNRIDSLEGYSVVEDPSASSGKRIGYVTPNSFLVFNTQVNAKQNFDIRFRYSSNDQTILNKSLNIYALNDGVEEYLGTANIDYTGGWDTYSTYEIKNITLEAGNQQLKVVFITDYFDLDYLEILTAVIPTPSPTPTVITPTPTPEPTVIPSPTPTIEPSVEPTVIPTIIVPTPTPTPVEPTPSPTPEIPTPTPTPVVPTPTPEPTVVPSPTIEPSVEPTIVPTVEPTVQPSINPTVAPSVSPTPTPTQDLVISNISVKSGEQYVHVVNGLKKGNKQYTDRRYKFVFIPEEFKGLDYIRTANDDKFSKAVDFLSFDTSKKLRVFVAHDDRIKDKPLWLKSFTKTNKKIISQHSAPLKVYYKDFEAGKVTLGGNVEKPKFINWWTSNYTVFFKVLE